MIRNRHNMRSVASLFLAKILYPLISHLDQTPNVNLNAYNHSTTEKIQCSIVGPISVIFKKNKIKTLLSFKNICLIDINYTNTEVPMVFKT